MGKWDWDRQKCGTSETGETSGKDGTSGTSETSGTGETSETGGTSGRDENVNIVGRAW